MSPYSDVIYGGPEPGEASGKVLVTWKGRLADLIVTCSFQVTELGWGKWKGEGRGVGGCGRLRN